MCSIREGNVAVSSISEGSVCVLLGKGVRQCLPLRREFGSVFH